MVQTYDQEPHTKLEKLYNYALTRPCGHTVEYRGYTLEKVDWDHPEHDEYTVKNRDGNTVDSYTITAFNSPRHLQQKLDQLIQENPDTVHQNTGGDCLE